MDKCQEAYTYLPYRWDIFEMDIDEYIDAVNKECNNGTDLRLSLELLSAYYGNIVCNEGDVKNIRRLNQANSNLLKHITSIQHLMTEDLRLDCVSAYKIQLEINKLYKDKYFNFEL